MASDLTLGMLPSASRKRRRRGAVAALALSVTLLGTLGYWLANSAGSSSPAITIAAGFASNGIASVTALTPADVTGQGQGASSIDGTAVDRIDIAASFANLARVSIAWLDPQDAVTVLNNPNAQLVFTLYHPVSTTASPDGLAGGSCPSDPGVKKIAEGAVTYCMDPDLTATGSPTVNDAGGLFLARNALVGYLIPTVNGNVADQGCDATPRAWCQVPAASGAGQRSIYVAVAITVPGGTPAGQQAQAGSLSFYIAVRPK
jgi:hypothetical protein